MKAKNVIYTSVFTLGVGLLINEIQKNNNYPIIYYLKTIAHNYNARTIPPFGIFILESEKNNQALLDHEMIHWRQFQRMGLVEYYSEYSRQMKEFGYDKMPMEIEARSNESEYVKYNYTEAVRNGTAKTIYNPNFRT